MGYIYVASPYTSKDDPSLEDYRAAKVEKFVAEWTRRGIILYSPIVHFHILSQVHNLPGSFDFWREHNTTMLRHAKELWVYTLDGWTESKGVTYEISTAQNLLIPVHFKDLPGWKEEANESKL